MNHRQMSLVALAIAATTAAVADPPRFRATKIADHGFFGGLNNLGQVSISRAVPGQGPLLWSLQGEQFVSALGPINDHGDIAQKFSFGLAIYNVHTQQRQMLSMPPIGLLDWQPLGINNNRMVVAEASLSDFYGYHWYQPNQPIYGGYNNRNVWGGLLNSQNEVAYYVPSLRRSVITRADGSRQEVRVPLAGSSINGLSDDGMMVVVGFNNFSDPHSTFLLNPDLTINRTIPNLSGFLQTNHARINNRGEIMGFATNDFNASLTQYRATYWSTTTGTVLLHSLVEGLPTGAALTTVEAINNQGQMVAVEHYELDGPNNLGRRYYFLDPVPEPASMTALAFGLAFLDRMKKDKAKSS